MPQRPALLIDVGLLPRRMHHFEDEPTCVPACQAEIVVVFAWQRPRIRRQFPPDMRGRTWVRPQSDASGAGAILHRYAMPGAAASGAVCTSIAFASRDSQSAG